MKHPSSKPSFKMKAPAETFWLYGRHAVGAALENPGRVKHRLLWTNEDKSLKIQNGLRPELCDRKALQNLLPPEAVHQGLALLVSPLAPARLEDALKCLEGAPRATLVVLDQVTDPHNVGAIMRSAVAFGADALIVSDDHSAYETGALAKAASGALEMIPLVRVVNLARALEKLKAEGFWCIGLDGHAEESVAGYDFPRQTAIVFGAEGEGLRRLTKEKCDLNLRLPISERMESLNVSTAAAVTLYARSAGRDPLENSSGSSAYR